MLGWWWHLTGPSGRLGWFFSTTGRWYAVTSGIGVPVAGLVGWWRHRVCHERFCWRFGHHPDPVDGSFRRCTRHHLVSRDDFS